MLLFPSSSNDKETHNCDNRQQSADQAASGFEDKLDLMFSFGDWERQEAIPGSFGRDGLTVHLHLPAGTVRDGGHHDITIICNGDISLNMSIAELGHLQTLLLAFLQHFLDLIQLGPIDTCLAHVNGIRSKAELND